MREYNKHQRNIIKNYYDNYDQIQLQKLQEQLTELYLAEGPARQKRWKAIVKALENLKVFDYKSALAEVRTGPDDVRVTMSLKGRERFGIFPSRVPEINVLNLPLGFLARQFPGS